MSLAIYKGFRGKLPPITDSIAARLKAGFDSGEFATWMDIWMFLSKEDGFCPSQLEAVLIDPNFDEFRQRFFSSYLRTVGIEDSTTIENLNSIMIRGPLSVWRKLVADEIETVHLEEKKREKERVVPFGVRISTSYNCDPIEILFLFLRTCL